MTKVPGILKDHPIAKELYDLIIVKFFECEYDEVEDAVAQVCVNWINKK